MSEVAAPVAPTAPAAPGTIPAPPPDFEVSEGGDDVISQARAEARRVLFEGTAEEGEEGKPPKAAAPEAPPEEKPKETDTELSRRFAKVHAQESRLKERQKAFLAEQETFKSTKAQIEQLQELARTDPVKMLENAGWTKDQVIEWIRSDGKIEPERLIKDIDERYRKEIDTLRAEREQERQELAREKREREVQKVEQMFVGEISHHLTSGQFPILASLVADDPQERSSLDHRVQEIVMQVWKSHQKVVEPHEALAYLEGRWAKTVSRLPGQAPAVKSATPVAVEPRPITNGATSQRSVQSPDYDEMNPEHRKARVAAILRGELEPD